MPLFPLVALALARGWSALEVNAREVPPGARLYLLDVTYYRDAQQGVYERAGLIRADVATRYVRARDFQPAEADCFVWSPRPQRLESLGEVEDLGHGLYRLHLSESSDCAPRFASVHSRYEARS